MLVDKKVLEFASERQKEIIEAYWANGNSSEKAGEALGISGSNVRRGIKRAKKNASKAGYAPEANMENQVATGFATKRVSTLYDEDGNKKIQWVISEREKETLAEALEDFKEGLKDDISGLHKPIQPPGQRNEELMACYVIGDFHYSMLAWKPETGVEDWDTDIADGILNNAFDKLCARATDAHYGMLLNVGDFLHADNSKSETGHGTSVDTDGRIGRTARKVGKLFKSIINKMLEVHQEVIIINARGNHDPDASLWMNEMLHMYYADDPRVTVKDNFNKFVWHTWGNNLIVTHHGDRLKAQRAYEAITMNLAEQWGQTKHRFLWMGHIHHKQAHEIGGMLCESFNVLAPPDAWHAGSGYGSSRSMTCILLNKEHGVDCRFMANIDELR